MADKIDLPATQDRRVLQRALRPQIEALLSDDTDLIAAMANMAAALKEAFGWHWIGFYRVIGNDLVLGPFQGPVACSRIGFGKGVCGSAWQQDRTLIVPDVEKFPGHIACSALSRSEIVVPIHDREGHVVAVLDIDSVMIDEFNTVDASFLEDLCNLLRNCQ